jgi:tetratricopeptide (TPR) repeat protein
MEASEEMEGCAMKHSETDVSEALVRTIEIALILLLLISPLLISTSLKQVFNTPKYVLVGFVALLLGMVHAVDCLFEQRLRLPRNLAGWSLMGFVLWGGLSMLWASDMAVSIRDFGYHSSMLAIFLGAFLYGREEERVDNLLHFPIAAGVLAAGYGLMQYYSLDMVLFRKVPGWAIPFAGALTMGMLGLRHSSSSKSLRPALGLAMMAGLAAGFQDQAVQALGFLVVVLWVFLRSLNPVRNPPITLFLRLLVGSILILLSTLLDGQLLLMLTAAILLDEAADCQEEDGLSTWLLAVGFMACTLTAAMKGWRLEFLILPKKPEEVVKIYSLMGHRNYLAGFLITVMPLAIVRLLAIWCVPAVEEERLGAARIWRASVYLLTVILMGLVLVLCQTRGAWIASIVSMGFLAVWLVLKYRPLRPFGMLGSIVGAVGLVVVGFGWKTVTIPGMGTYSNPLNLHPKSVGIRAAESLNIQGGSAFQRALIYRTTWRIIFDNPINCLFGTGIGTYGLNYMPAQKHVLEVPSNLKYMPLTNKSIYAHNEYWHYWSEVGLVGLLLLFGFLYNLAHSAHFRLREENAGVPNLMFMGMCASLLATVVHNIFTFDWHLAYSGAIFYSLAGIVLAQADGSFWVYSWLPKLRASSRGKKALAQLSGEIREGVLSFDIEVEPHLAPDVELVLVDPIGVRTPLTSDENGVFQVFKDEEYGVWKVLLSSVEKGMPPLEFQVKEPQSGASSVLGLMILILIGVPLAQSLSNEILRDYHWRNGFLKFRLRRFEDAFLDLERAVNADPTKGEVLFDFGRALMDSGRNAAAIQLFKEAKATFVDPANDHNIALCYYKKGDRAKAEEYYRKALSLNEIYEQSMANLAYMMIQDNRDAEAIPLLERGLNTFPRNARFPTSLAIIYTRKQDFPKAKIYYDKALKLGPKRASVYLNAGTVDYSMGLVKQASEAFQKALELEPKNQIAKQKLAIVQLAILAEQVKKTPQDLNLRRRYCLALLATGQAGPAASESRNILKAYPNDGTVRFVFARALEAQGYREDARREYARVQDVPGSPEILARARARLEAMQKGGGDEHEKAAGS